MTSEAQMVALMTKHGLPDWTHPELLAYIQRGQFVGSFLEAILSNDLCEAVNRCMAEEWSSIPMFAVFLYNHAPARCWGSPAAYQTWRAHHGLEGLSA